MPSQDQEGCLEGVFRVLFVVQHPPTHPQDHRPVPRDQGSEGGLVAASGEVVQKLAVRDPPG